MSDKLPVSNEHLIRLAGKPAFNRGVDYFKSGNVLKLKQKGNVVTAEVAGTEVYRVKLKWTSSQLDGACNCPASDGFDFCKHCVAVALVLQQTQAEQDQLIKGGAEDRIRAYLLKQDK
ncbi:MAG: SWIM zinc finger family protein, partial [Gammaproteobacteria bacterium]|nr:SWIM zinc finger family protein [Gammaproteobacteria bacterium]